MDCPRCDGELEPAFENEGEHDYFCIKCGGLFDEADVEE